MFHIFCYVQCFSTVVCGQKMIENHYLIAYIMTCFSNFKNELVFDLGYFCCCHCCRYWNSAMTSHLRQRVMDLEEVPRRARTCGRGRRARGRTSTNSSIADSWYFLFVKSFLSLDVHFYSVLFTKKSDDWRRMNQNVICCLFPSLKRQKKADRKGPNFFLVFPLQIFYLTCQC